MFTMNMPRFLKWKFKHDDFSKSSWSAARERREGRERAP
jgi:hypothetical protein